MLKKLGNLLDKMGGTTRSTSQIQRIVLLSGVLLVLLAVSFGAYYYYDRYYQPQQSIVDERVKAAEDAVRADPNNIGLRINLANTYLAIREYQKALEIGTPLLAEEPDNPDLLIVLGIANVLNDSPETGIPFLEKFVGFYAEQEMVGFNKAYKTASYYLGDAYLMTSQPDKAVHILEHLYSLDSADADAMYKLGVAYTNIGDTDRAKVILHQATLFVPDFKEVYEQLAIVFETTGETALLDYAKGMIAFCEEDYPTALTLLQGSAAADQTSAPTYNGLAMVYEKMNDITNARANYAKALEIDPDYLSAQNGLGRMDTLLK